MAATTQLAVDVSDISRGGREEPEVRPDTGLTRVCCGTMIRPRLAEIPDQFGQTLFVAVWPCTRCGRLIR
jgi:hypothetical protein